MTKEVILTPRARKIKTELEKLIKVDRAEIVARFAAKEFGDLSENAEYGVLRMIKPLPRHIQELEDMIRRAKVVVHHAGDALLASVQMLSSQ